MGWILVAHAVDYHSRGSLSRGLPLTSGFGDCGVADQLSVTIRQGLRLCLRSGTRRARLAPNAMACTDVSVR
jgi:hypothetical protein